jgi:hypothetical protein
MSQRSPDIIVHLRGGQNSGQLALIELVVATGAAGPPIGGPAENHTGGSATP